jgi:hypothetical protein
MGKRVTGSDAPGQLLIDWSSEGTAKKPADVEEVKSPPPSRQEVPPLVQRLPWDFKTTFPEPLEEAIESGVADETDREPANLKSLHENYASQCLSVLAARDKVMDARRKGVDPGTGQKPRTQASRERLRKYLAEEPTRLDHTFDVLIDTYAEAFGLDAADAFEKAIVAWHAGIEVRSNQAAPPEEQPAVRRKPRRSVPSSRLPVPRPLESAVSAGLFGEDENGKPIRPKADEVRGITEQHAERMMEMTDAELSAAVTKYAEDFGPKPASQLERYVRRRRDAEHSR